MWTPKRIVILSACFVGFVAIYLGYACSAIGRIDGLPPLPDAYLPGEIDDDWKPPEFIPSRLEKQICQAFGENCKELKRSIRLALPSKNMVLAAEHFEVARDGRVCLSPISVALFGKEKKEGQGVEISVIRADVAWLKFDRPVSNFSELGSRKIVEAELNGKIDLTNNRRRKERDQDLNVFINLGPLFYNEESHRIWTHSWVKLEDHKSKPDPHVVEGQGMELELQTEAPGQPGRKAQKDAITGVKWIVLQRAVRMKIYTDGKDRFLANDAQPGPGKQPDKAADKKPNETITSAHSVGVAAVKQPDKKPSQQAVLHITTPGKFRYDIFKDHDEARFDALVSAADRLPPEPPQVCVVRHNLATDKRDTLVCHHLTLVMRRKDGSEGSKGKANPAGEEKSEGAEIETAHAISPGNGRMVILSSEVENLTAEGLDFFYDARAQKTTLKGRPVHVKYKNDTDLYAREVEIQDVKPEAPAALPGQPRPVAPKPYQKLLARGPGKIFLVDKGEKGEKRNVRADWEDTLTSTKDNGQDLVILTGNARFHDEQAQQSLSGDTLKVWLDAAEQAKSNPADGAAGSRKPRHVEAVGLHNNVVARSRELNVHDTSRLVIWFKDVPAQMHLPGAAAPAPSAWPSVVTTPAAPPSAPTPPSVDKRPVATPAPATARPVDEPLPTAPRAMPKGPAHTTSKAAAPPRPAGPELAPAEQRPAERPFDLSARTVEARIFRSPIKSTVDELWCEGRVQVRQDPAKAEEKGTHITGDTLKMTHEGEGLYYLVVTGDLAKLETDKICIYGPEVNINQGSNKAWVYGDGAMTMVSATSFEGKALDRPVPLTVHWSKSMVFNGTSAEFLGNIQGEQQKARLACQHLQVTFDRLVSLKQGNKSDQPARVQKMVSDGEVRVDDRLEEDGKLVKYQLLEAPTVYMDSLDPEDEQLAKDPRAKKGNKVTASGPGVLRVWQPGSNDLMVDPDLAPPPSTPARKTDADKEKPAEFKLTCVWFKRRMDANNQTQTAWFWEQVRVLSLPSDRHDRPIDLGVMLATDLPEDAMYLACDRLQVLDQPTPEKLPNKQMKADGNVYVQGREFWARAAAVHYNEAKQQVILDGKDGWATLSRVTRPGAPPEQSEGKKIIYNRKTRKVDVIQARQVQGESLPSRM